LIPHSDAFTRSAGAAYPEFHPSGGILVDFLIAFVLFLLSIILCMVTGSALYWALLAGFFFFFSVGLHRGFSCRDLLSMSIKGALSSLVVQRIMLVIGLLTALWRASGTIAFFVHTGIRFITPHSFILIAFLLPGLLCMALGSSFGVASTAGIIVMTIARSGNANLVVAAGAVLSGCYLGERLSPAASASALVATISEVDQSAFHRQMWRTSVLPLSLTLLFYLVCSFLFPIQSVDVQVLSALEAEFRLLWPTLLPALALVTLPWLHLSAFWSIVVSCVLAFPIALLVQDIPLGELLHACILGYTAQQPELVTILSGGGLISMLSVVIILFLSCAYSGLFNGTGMLDPYKEKLCRLADRIGLYPVQMLLGLLCPAIFCNQAVSIVMGGEIMKKRYQELGLSNMELAINLGNSAINLAGVVPWCIACSVPLTAIGGSMAAIPFAVFLYLVPLCHWLTGHSRRKLYS